jgi:hypothetical protein
MATQDNANTMGFHDISNHQLVRRIGEGAYGEVWLAHNVLGVYRSGGLLRGDSLHEAGARCEIYTSYLKRHLR